jgi:hypothetical protein
MRLAGIPSAQKLAGAIAAAYADGTVHLWDASSGKQVGSFKAHENARDASFSPDGLHVIVTSEDGTAVIWRVFDSAKDLIGYAKSAIPRCLTREQREAAFLNPEPPAWCIDMAKWPYQTEEWKSWLAQVKAGQSPPLPNARAR